MIKGIVQQVSFRATLIDTYVVDLMDEGKTVAAPGLSGHEPPTARLSRRKKGWSNAPMFIWDALWGLGFIEDVIDIEVDDGRLPLDGKHMEISAEALAVR